MTLGRPVQISLRVGWPLFVATTNDPNVSRDDQLDVRMAAVLPLTERAYACLLHQMACG